MLQMEWPADVALNFGSLAFDAGASSITHISSDTRLYKSCSHKALSSLYAWVWKAMQRVKYLTSKLFRYGDSSKGECRIRWLDLLQFTVSCLCLSKCTEVYSCQSRVEVVQSWLPSRTKHWQLYYLIQWHVWWEVNWEIKSSWRTCHGECLYVRL